MANYPRKNKYNNCKLSFFDTVVNGTLTCSWIGPEEFFKQEIDVFCSNTCWHGDPFSDQTLEFSLMVVGEMRGVVSGQYNHEEVQEYLKEKLMKYKENNNE